MKIFTRTLNGDSFGLSPVVSSDQADRHTHHRQEDEEEIGADQDLDLVLPVGSPEAFLVVEMTCLQVEILLGLASRSVEKLASLEVRSLVESLVVALGTPGAMVASLVRPSLVEESLVA